MKNKMSVEQLQNAWKKPERGTGLPNNYYPFWNMKEGETAIIRFLPDAVENPLGFMVEKVMHNLVINGERKSVPCMSMYGEKCPICAVSQDFYKREDKDNGKKYWKKKQYIAQAVIMKDPLPVSDGEESHEGKVRFVTINYSLFKIIKDAFESGELEEIPYAYVGGTDFIIKKDMQGDYPSYILSKFARRSTDIEDVYELTDLSSLLPKNPGLERVESMLEAALSGGNYQESSSPAPHENSLTESLERAVASAKAEKVEKVEKPEAASSSVTEDEEVDEEVDNLLAEIRSRRAKKES